MPFIKLNNSWSDLAKQYNTAFNNKPEIPAIRYSSFDDGLIRGGVLNTTIASVRDTARIGKFFASGKGILFLTKQVGLQLSNPLLEQLPSTPAPTSNQNILNNVGNAINNFINKRSPNQIYNLGLNTITQIPITALGGHIIRHGILPVGGVGFLNGSTDNIKGYNYEAITKQNNANSKPSNVAISYNPFTSAVGAALANADATANLINNTGTNNYILPADSDKPLLYASPQDEKLGIKSIFSVAKSENEVIITAAQNIKLSYSGLPNRLLRHFSSISTTVDKGKNVKVTSDVVLTPVNLLSYNGGASSVYGIGITNINTSPDQRTNISSNKSDPKSEYLNGFKPRSYSKLDDISNKFRSFYQTQPAGYITPIQNGEGKETVNETNYNIESRIGVSRIGKQNSDRRTVDSINTISILDSKTFYNNSLKTNEEAESNTPGMFTYTPNTKGKVDGETKFGRDIIKFRLEFLNNNVSSTSTDVLAFRAYIDDFNDGMSARWNPYRYMGRGEEFYIYDGFTRDISVSFTMYAHSPSEMKPLYQKLNYLMSTFTPDYSEKLKMRGNIGYLTVGDYLYRQPGVFTDIKLTGFLDTHWEIALNDPEGGSDNNQFEVPKHIKVALSFKPIHTFLPRRAYNKTLSKSPFITVDKVAYPAQAGDNFEKNDKGETVQKKITTNKYLD